MQPLDHGKLNMLIICISLNISHIFKNYSLSRNLLLDITCVANFQCHCMTLCVLVVTGALVSRNLRHLFKVG